jgi:hypothetical protein
MASRKDIKKQRTALEKSVGNSVSKPVEPINRLEADEVAVIAQPALTAQVVVTQETPADTLAGGEEALPVVQGVVGRFLPPNVLVGWAFYQEGAKLRVRVVAGAAVWGETYADEMRPAPALAKLNEGLVGWRLKIDRKLSAQEFVELAQTIDILVLDESDNVVGQLPIKPELLESLRNGE